MQVLQVLLVINVAAFTLAGFGGTGSIDSKTDSYDGSSYESESFQGWNPYLFIYRVYRRFDSSLAVNNDSSVKYDITVPSNGNNTNSNSNSSLSRGSKDSRSNSKGRSGERGAYPNIHKLVKSSAGELKSDSTGIKSSKKRQRRNSDSSYYSTGRARCPCSAGTRGGPSPQLNNRWQQRDEAMDYLRFARTRSRRLFGSDSKGGYPFPHSLRRRRNSESSGGRTGGGGGPSPQQNPNWQPRGGTADFRIPPTWNQRPPGSDAKGGYPYPHSERRRRSCCSGFKSSTNINSDTTFRTGSIKTISFRTRDPEDSKGGYPFPHSCKKR